MALSTYLFSSKPHQAHEHEHGSHLVGFEAYYTVTKRLENNPYRDKSDAYWHLGLLGQITLWRISCFINAENWLNVRQTPRGVVTAIISRCLWTLDNRYLVKK